MFVIGNSTENFRGASNNLGPVEVTSSEIKEFKKRNPEPGIIESLAEKIKREHQDYEHYEYCPEVICVLYLKESHYEKINRYIKKALALFRCLSAFSDNQWVVQIMRAIDSNSSELVSVLVKYLGPDLQIPDDEIKETSFSEEKEQKIITSNRKGKNISGILKDFNFPEQIAIDIQEIYNNGLGFEPVGHLIVSLFTFVTTRKAEQKAEKKQATNFQQNQVDIDTSEFD